VQGLNAGDLVGSADGLEEAGMQTRKRIEEGAKTKEQRDRPLEGR
jgi:hypothetical protein